MQVVEAFVNEYLPDVDPPPGKGILKPRHILFDKAGHYPDITFSPAELAACTQAYVNIIDPVIEEVKTIDRQMSQAVFLYNSHFNDACEVMLMTIYRARKDECYGDMLRVVAEINASEKVNDLLMIVDPEAKNTYQDVFKHLRSLRQIFHDLAAEYEGDDS